MGLRNIVADAFKYLPQGCWFQRYSEYCPNQASLKTRVPK